MKSSAHDCHDELHALKLKVTPARLAVLDVLEKSDMPMDAAAIATQLRRRRIDADKVTIFRVLHAFTKNGLVKPIELGEGKMRYEYAAKPTHHHFVCESCNTIIDVEGCGLDKLEQEIAKKKGVQVLRHSLEFFGLCARCQH